MLAAFVQSGAISFFEIHMLNFLTVHPIFHEFSPNVSSGFSGGIFPGGAPGLTVLVPCRSFLTYVAIPDRFWRKQHGTHTVGIACQVRHTQKGNFH